MQVMYLTPHSDDKKYVLFKFSSVCGDITKLKLTKLY